MKKDNKFKKRILSMLMASVIAVSLILGGAATVFAAPSGGETTKIADEYSIEDWRNYFGDANTTYTGGVWGDKSVFLSEQDYLTALQDSNDEGVTASDIAIDDENFLIALSAIAANKEIVGYSTIPTDTMFVLDLSNSMSDDSIEAMIDATNDAIRKLLDLNDNNRVGVVLYGGSQERVLKDNATPDRYGNYDRDDYETKYTYDASVTLLMPLDRYTGVAIDGKETFVQFTNGTVRTARTGSNNNRTYIKNSSNQEVNTSKSAGGATYIQGGLYEAWKQFKAKGDANDTVVTDGFQKGTSYMPVLVLMSDGAPTLATNQYNNVLNPERGTGGASSATEANAFLAQLTASWVKENMTKAYNKASLVYTLGLNVGGNSIASSVLNPFASTENISKYWETYEDAQENSNVTITNNLTVKKDSADAVKNYVNAYYPASDADGLIKAFGNIVDQIIIQSRYYPTHAESGDHELDGYIFFTDELGNYMEVKSIKGLSADRKFYSGAAMAKAIKDGVFGDIYGGNINNLNDTGQTFLSAVSQRLGTNADQAKTLIYLALQNGQLSYTNDNNYSNYIGWYSKDDTYLGFWDGNKESSVPAEATHRNKSYGFLGTVGSAGEYNVTDMMHIIVQIREDISTGHQTVMFKIPAALIPTITYEIDIENASSYEEINENSEITMDISPELPIRLLYEAGLRSDINAINVTEKAENHGHINADGSYDFYTNWWHVHGDETEDELYIPEKGNTTWLDLEPSVENERYYFTQDTVILDANGNEVSSVSENGNYYYKQMIFKSDASGNASMEFALRPIDSQAIKSAISVDGKLVVPKGTIKQADDHDTVYKRINGVSIYDEESQSYISADAKGGKTDTLDFIRHPQLTLPSGSTKYHMSAYLGNNGKYTLMPATGLKITKDIDRVVTGTSTENFAFTVTFSTAVDFSKISVLGEDYQALASTDIAIDAQNNTLTVSNIADGESVYIIGLAAGTVYTVSEADHEDYALSVVTINGQALTSATGWTHTASNHAVDDIVFTNTYKIPGGLIITKNLEHPFKDGSTEAANIAGKTFDINVNLGSKYANADITTSKGNVKADANGEIVLNIAAGESVLITDIDSDTPYTVKETSLAEGFTIKSVTLDGNDVTNNIAGGEIESNTTHSVVFTNEYKPEGLDQNILVTLKGTKTLSGRNWKDDDKFVFELQYLNKDYQWVKLAEQTVLGTDADKSFSFDTSNAREPFEVGTYQYRIIETLDNVGGITYDITEHHFHIIVTDEDIDGNLEISDVVATSPTTIDKNNNSYVLTANFTNKYAPLGSADITVNVTKELENTTGVDASKAGFTFELYSDSNGNGVLDSADTLAGTSTQTDAAGFAYIRMVYPATMLKNAQGEPITDELKLNYFLKEHVPADADKAEGISYNPSGTVYPVTVRIYDNLDGSIKAQVYPTGAAGAEANADNIYGNASGETATFTNVYSLTPATITFGGEKELTGRVMTEDEFSFMLYETADDFDTSSLSPVDTKTNKDSSASAKDSITFDEIELKSAGNYYFVIKEDTSAAFANGVYDKNEYRVTVSVGKKDGSAALEIKEIKYLKGKVENGVFTPDTTNGSGTAADGNFADFTNEYIAEPISGDIIKAVKTLSGRAIKDNEFKFDLYETDAAFDISNVSPKVNDEPAVKENSDDTFAKAVFDEIEFDKAGTYYFSIVEDNTDALPGVTYDDNKFDITITVKQRETNDANGEGAIGELYIESMTIKDKAAKDVTAEGITFNNSYAPTPTDVSFDITKQMTGRNMQAGEFKFEIKHAVLNGTELSIYDDAASSITNDLTGMISTASFDVNIAHGGEHWYVVSEVKGNAAGVTYDASKYAVLIKTHENADAKVVKDAILFYEIDEQTMSLGNVTDKITFNNSYKAPSKPTNPPQKNDPQNGSFVKTGDSSNIAVVVVIIIAAVAALAAVMVVMRKRASGKN